MVKTFLFLIEKKVVMSISLAFWYTYIRLRINFGLLKEKKEEIVM